MLQCRRRAQPPAHPGPRPALDVNAPAACTPAASAQKRTLFLPHFAIRPMPSSTLVMSYTRRFCGAREMTVDSVGRERRTVTGDVVRAPLLRAVPSGWMHELIGERKGDGTCRTCAASAGQSVRRRASGLAAVFEREPPSSLVMAYPRRFCGGVVSWRVRETAALATQLRLVRADRRCTCPCCPALHAPARAATLWPCAAWQRCHRHYAPTPTHASPPARPATRRPGSGPAALALTARRRALTAIHPHTPTPARLQPQRRGGCVRGSAALALAHHRAPATPTPSIGTHLHPQRLGGLVEVQQPALRALHERDELAGQQAQAGVVAAARACGQGERWGARRGVE